MFSLARVNTYPSKFTVVQACFKGDCPSILTVTQHGITKQLVSFSLLVFYLYYVFGHPTVQQINKYSSSAAKQIQRKVFRDWNEHHDSHLHE